MKLKVYNCLLFLLLALPASAQFTLSGIIRSMADSSTVDSCQVILNGKRITYTDAKGYFRFENLSSGSYNVQTTVMGYQSASVRYQLNRTREIEISLQALDQNLETVTIKEKQNDFGMSRLRGVEHMAIYEGKKSEVIDPDKITANLSTNNARQIFAKVAGLNIWENEGGGLQLNIGGRGLDPNRTSNFNVRQNGYDISADALGYPESYYTPPIEAVGRIQIVRGAASLQYGTQFGGLINFVMRKPVADKKLELTARQSVGSFGFYNTFTSVSGTVGKLSYYSFFQYKRADGWRDNSQFNNHTFYADIDYQLTEKASIGLDITQMNYLAKQPGGLSDQMFASDPRQTNRERNWFDVKWNMLALHYDYKFNKMEELNFRVFGLNAHRYSVGFRPNRVATIDDNGERDLIKGEFQNWGAEARYLKRYYLGKQLAVLLAGSRYYHGYNESQQGVGSTGKDADFRFTEPDKLNTYSYEFPNRNMSVFLENIFYIGDKWSITPGLRYEWINTQAEGYYGNISRDLAGNIIAISKNEEYRQNKRQFLLAGLGLSFKPAPTMEVYANLSQNYRSITFSDMRISNPSSVIDPDMQDEKGYSLDLGFRSQGTSLITYDASLFLLNYNNRIGEVQFYDESNRVLRLRTNVGQALIAGLETYVEADIFRLLYPGKEDLSVAIFSNLALIGSEYVQSTMPGIQGNEVEFVPKVNFKTGIKVGYRDLKASLQLTHLSKQYSDATNAPEGGISSVVGIIPAYKILDLSLSYDWNKFRIEGSVNNLANEMYFTRRATGYPGPGILPSDGRGFFLTLQVKL